MEARDGIIVIGGGLVGAASALRLLGAGLAVTLVDPMDDRGRASFGNAGLICPELVEPLCSWAELRAAPGRHFAFGGPLDVRLQDLDRVIPWGMHFIAACNRFEAGTEALSGLLAQADPAWKRLLGDIGRMDLRLPSSRWSVWETRSSAEAGLRAARSASWGTAKLVELGPDEIGALEAAFSRPFGGGVAIEGSAKIVNPGAAVRAIHEAITARGGTIVQGRAVSLGPDEAGVTVTLAEGGSLRASRVLVCAGARSSELLGQLSPRPPLIAERGYHIQFAQHDWPAALPTIIFEDRWACVGPLADGVRATGFTELARADTPPDARKWVKLRGHLAALGIPVHDHGVEWMGPRPTLPDFLPAIGRLEGAPRVLYAFGHQHIGLTLAAATGEAVAELATANATPTRLQPFDLKRFG